jgi:hypothetical protein
MAPGFSGGHSFYIIGCHQCCLLFSFLQVWLCGLLFSGVYLRVCLCGLQVSHLFRLLVRPDVCHRVFLLFHRACRLSGVLFYRLLHLLFSPVWHRGGRALRAGCQGAFIFLFFVLGGSVLSACGLDKSNGQGKSGAQQGHLK